MAGTDPCTYAPTYVNGKATWPGCKTTAKAQDDDTFLVYTPDGVDPSQAILDGMLAQVDAEEDIDYESILQSLGSYLAQLDDEEREELGIRLAQEADRLSAGPSQLAQTAAGAQAMEFWACTLQGQCETAIGNIGHKSQMLAPLGGLIARFL